MTNSEADHRTQLLGLARTGSPPAIEELFASYQHYLRILARNGLSRRVQTRVTISDVIQETFLHAFESFDRFRGRTTGEFVAWIRSILVSRIADAHEKHLATAKRDVRRETSLQTIDDDVSRSAVRLERIAVNHMQRSPGSIVSHQELSVVVADAIAALPKDYQTVIAMRHFDELPFDEIAAAMQRTSGAVRMVWLRAIQQMKRSLKENEC